MCCLQNRGTIVTLGAQLAGGVRGDTCNQNKYALVVRTLSALALVVIQAAERVLECGGGLRRQAHCARHQQRADGVLLAAFLAASSSTADLDASGATRRLGRRLCSRTMTARGMSHVMPPARRA